MRIVLTALFVASAAGIAMADGQAVTSNTVALQTTDQQSAPLQAPADTTSNTEQSFYGFSGGCDHQSAKSDTTKLLMN